MASVGNVPTTSHRESNGHPVGVDKLHEEINEMKITDDKVQRQLQLRIEAQGKYLKNIIEEKQRLSGVLGETTGSGVSVPPSGENLPEADNKTDPSTPAPTSESPLLESGRNVESPVESPKGERPMKKQRLSIDAVYKPEMVLTHQILESSLNAYQEQHPLYITGEQFDPSSGITNEHQF